MDKTPIRVYEDKHVEILKTPHSSIQRVLNITPTNGPLSPKDINVPTPAIFKPKKIQIPDIFSPISKIKSLQTRKKYTVNNDENCENFGEERVYNAVTSTPIVPRRNRIYHNHLIPTPKTENKHINNEKLLINKVEIGAKEKPAIRNNAFGTLYDKCNVRQNSVKENFAIELQAAMKNKNLKSNIQQKEDLKPNENTNVIREIQIDNEEEESDAKGVAPKSPKIKINASNSFEELKRRFEQVKSRATEAIDKSLLEKISSKSENIKDPQYGHDNKTKYSEQKSPPTKDVMKNANEQRELKSGHQQNNFGDQKVIKTPNVGNRETSVSESPAQQTGSNLDFYTALPELTFGKRSIPLFAINENGETCEHFQRKNDMSGIQSIPQSLNSTSVNFHSNEQSSNNVNSGKKKRLGPTKPKFTSKIPKLNFERDNNVRLPQILIRDEDIDRITYKLNLGTEKSLNSASKERAAIRRQTPVSLKSGPRKNTQRENDSQDKGRNVAKIKLMYQTPMETKRKKLYENVENKKSSKKSTKSEPKTRLALMITRQNKSETEVIKHTTGKEVSLNHKHVCRKKMSFTSHNNISECENSHIKTTAQNRIISCGNNISSQDTSGLNGYANQSQNSKKKSKRSQDPTKREEANDTDSNKELKDVDTNQVNSTFVIPRTNSRHCSCSTINENSPTPQSTLSTNSTKHKHETRNKSARSSLESLGGCFKFRRKQSFFPSNQNSLKRSYSFIHVSINENKNTPKSLSIASLSQSFSKSITNFTADKASNSFPSAKTLKKRKQLKDLTTEYRHRRDQQDERNGYSPTPSRKVLEHEYVYPQNYGNCNVSLRDELTEPDSLNTIQENRPSQNKQKLIKIDIENDYHSDDREHCIVLNDEFYINANRIANNQKDLLEISKDVRTVENELIDLSKMHEDIQLDLGTKWMRPNQKASSLSDVSERNVLVKDDAVEKGCILLRNAEKEKENENKKISKSQLNCSSPKESQGHRNENLICTNCLASCIPAKSSRYQDQAKREKYLEEQNHRAIQMIESRLTRLENKLEALHSDIRHLIQVKDSSTGLSTPPKRLPALLLLHRYLHQPSSRLHQLS
ncbi:hypothetical protein WDU94_015451 [Cyamophila willieti]